MVWWSADTYRVVESRIRFEALFRDNAAVVRAYAARRIGRDDADDVVGEVFLIAWRRLDDLPEEPGPWLLGVARRVIANRRRGELRRSAMHDRLSAGAARVAQPREPQGTDGAVAAALARLDERDVEVLLLTAWDGLGHADAARVLGIRTGTLTVRLHRARRRFARLLAEAESVEPTPAPMEVL
jgi:RNA polymerase sigma-70 factor (ECF subfamily)